MTFINRKVTIIAMIVLICVLLFFTLWDIQVRLFGPSAHGNRPGTFGTRAQYRRCSDGADGQL